MSSKQLAFYFLKIGEKQLEIVQLKQVLVSHKSFNSLRYFKYLANYKTDIQINDLQSLSSSYGFQISHDDLSSIMDDTLCENW